MERYRDRILGSRAGVEAHWGGAMKHLDLLIEARGLKLPHAKTAMAVKHIADGKKHKASRHTLKPIKEGGMNDDEEEEKKKKKEKKLSLIHI